MNPWPSIAAISIGIAAGILVSHPCHAEIWASTMPYVHHTTDTRRSGEAWNSSPLGAGLHYTGHAVEADFGAFRNSYGRQSFAAGASLPLLTTTYGSAGVFAALASGYHVPLLAGAFVEARYESIALRLLITPQPDGQHAVAVGFQLRARLD